MMKVILTLLMLLTITTISCKKDQAVSQQPASGGLIVYVGTYTGEGSAGIYAFRMNEASGELTQIHSINDPNNPSFLEVDPEKKYLYAVHELGNYMGRSQGAIRAYAIDSKTWNLTMLNEQPSHGAHPCFVSVDAAGRVVMLANYSGGNVAVYPIKEDGSLGQAGSVIQHEGSGAVPSRQSGPHAHSITPSPDGRFAFAADLGIDKIMTYQIDAENAKLIPADPPHTNTAPGAGPRHFTFHPGGSFAYGINELNSTITAYAYHAGTGGLSPIETVGTLPSDFADWNACADIHCSPDGRYLFGSNRGHDSLVIFRVDNNTGKLSLIGHQPVEGRTPRNFAVDPTGTFILVANQDTNNIVVFRFDPDKGTLTPTGHGVQISKPVCVKILTTG